MHLKSQSMTIKLIHKKVSPHNQQFFIANKKGVKMEIITKQEEIC